MSSPYEPLPAEVLIQQGSCCGNWCTNCPYVNEDGESHVAGSTQLAPQYQPKLDQKQKAPHE